MNKPFLLFLIVVLVTSCKTNQLFISVLAPAPVTISNAVKKIGIVNRSIPADDDKALNAVHQVISMESFAMLKEGSIESIRGLKDALMQNKRFEFVNVLDTVKLRSTVAGVFPAPLSWETVEDICQKNNLDALFVLEMFDTELKINPTGIPANVTNPMQVINAAEHMSMNTLVQTGWRIYDPGTRAIIDEFTLVKNMTFNSNGNPAATADVLIQRKEYVKRTANLCGHDYSERILSHWFRVERDYFVKGSNNFKIAKRRARSGNWDGAAELWQKEVSNPKRKVAGRACFNMGVINEINGNLDEAIKWTQKAYEDYRIRSALNYIHILRARKAQNDLLNIQKTE